MPMVKKGVPDHDKNPFDQTLTVTDTYNQLVNMSNLNCSSSYHVPNTFFFIQFARYKTTPFVSSKPFQGIILTVPAAHLIQLCCTKQ